MSERGNQFLRWADRYLGIPLVFTLGILSKRQKNFIQKPQRIGILATAAIGDTILLSAILKDLRAHEPQAQITLFVGKSNEAIAKLMCPVDQIVCLPVSRPDSAIKKIRNSGHFNWWLDFGPWPRLNAFLSYWARADYRVGFSSPGQHRHFIYQQVVEHRNDCHEIENLRRLLSVFKIKSESLPHYHNERTKKKSSKDFFEIAIHMFPGGYMAHFKEWHPHNWVDLINRLTARGYRVVLTGAPVDASRAELILRQCEFPKQIRNFAGQMSLQQTANLLSDADLVISVNTGIMHLAAACGVPLIALNGPTSSLRWGPLGDQTKTLNLNATSPSAGCLHLGFEYDKKDPNSLDTISVKQVEDAVEKMLKC
ncbi:MAG: glycosyltransferase family 9 protein [Deltaproteobacteria bacterium]|nr:glycosyltransferase family 9 protein [Deltaproteobacteria bacterium]